VLYAAAIFRFIGRSQMRFIQHGPSIPDDLLTARDEGRVVFFCGAGVSRARANLSDFFGLADDVLKTLGVSSDDPACKILDEARSIEGRTGVGGLISADRIFGLLERSFVSRDIEAAVASALKPSENVDRSAHRILLNLATTLEGRVQLVTTNFDRLFEDFDNTLSVWSPPNLPDPTRPGDLNGVIHLHGRANKTYDASEGDGFILSSAEFGRAYLSDGWATDFFRKIIDRYVVVFVGYAADDPPVQYLLEALNKKAGQLDGVYAFQSGNSNEAAARWIHKGVEAIAYEEEDRHKALWETLEAWSKRAKDPEGWYKVVVESARKGPTPLKPHERGQVAHILNTLEGTRAFHERGTPPPAEWLCVLDPARRYARPGRTGGVFRQGPFVDPFDLFGLDTDEAPEKEGPEKLASDLPLAKREIPRSAWDGFAAQRRDLQDLQNENFSAIRGRWAENHANLAPRLMQIGIWISKISCHPTAVWWASHQLALHPFIVQQIKWELERSPREASPEVRKAWRYLFEAWADRRPDHHHDWYDLKAIIDKDGWDSSVLRRFAAIHRPYLKVEASYWQGHVPPDWSDDLGFRDLIHLDVKYPDFETEASVPDEWLPLAVTELRKNLERAVLLETELGKYGLSRIGSLFPDDETNEDEIERRHGLTGCLTYFSNQFTRLTDLDQDTARHEFLSWQTKDDAAFSRLRIWACGDLKVTSRQIVCSTILDLSDDTFWSIDHQRDLLLVLAKRWADIADENRIPIEKRLLNGRPQWGEEDDEEFDERQAWLSLNRITWLANNGCSFAIELEAEIEKLRSRAPEWKPVHAALAVQMKTGHISSVQTVTEHAVLLEEPLASTLAKALELSGRTEDRLVEKDPFSGLATEHPIRAIAVLSAAAKRGEYPEWAWHTFLNRQRRQDDPPRLAAFIAERLSSYPITAISDLIRPASDWLLIVSKNLTSAYPASFEKVTSRLIEVLELESTESGTTIVRTGNEPDWATEALNAPAGKIAQALFNSPSKNGLKTGQRFPTAWLAHVDKLLALHGDAHRHALVIFAHNLGWFFAIDPKWTETNLVSVLDRDDEDDRSALWSGFLWGARLPSQALYMRIKSDLLDFAKNRSFVRRGHDEVLAGIILAGWANTCDEGGERYISSAEMCEVILKTDDELRSRILWQLQQWSQEGKGDANLDWSTLLPEFLRQVWPRHKSVKSPTISARLCDLVLASNESFPELVQIVLPLVTVIDRDFFWWPDMKQTENNLAFRYPEETLALLHTVLPENARSWPYGTGPILERIGDASNDLRRDERLIELKRRWNSR